MGFGTVSKNAAPRVPLRHGEGNKDHLTSFGGLAALSLDALSSVAYGPQAIVRYCSGRHGGAAPDAAGHPAIAGCSPCWSSPTAR
jgi:hypothetical protein